MAKTKIIGVLHHPDRIESTKKKLKDMIEKGQRIGIEPSPEDLLKYRQVGGKEYPIDELCAMLKRDDQLEGFPINELVGIKYFHQFYFAMYEFLHELRTLPVAVGSKVRERFRFDLIRDYFVKCKEFDSESYFLEGLVTQPHFDHYVAEKIKTEDLDAVIIGCAHEPISRFVRGTFVDLSGRSPESVIESREKNKRLYRSYKVNKFRLQEL